MYLCAICKSNICFICLTIFFLEKFKDFVLVTYPSQSSHASIFLDQKPQNLVAFLHFFQLSVITSKPKHVNFQCLWFRDSKQYIDILPKKIVLFPIPILILFLLSHRLSIGFPSPPKICKSRIGFQLHRIECQMSGSKENKTSLFHSKLQTFN